MSITPGVLVHTTTGCGKQGFPSAQPYLSHTPGANPLCCMFLRTRFIPFYWSDKADAALLYLPLLSPLLAPPLHPRLKRAQPVHFSYLQFSFWSDLVMYYCTGYCMQVSAEIQVGDAERNPQKGRGKTQVPKKI
ncbi:hypothetical protein BO99DRAFT_454271, partial [Aspergillus violaceofuscus CBS 115571]